MRYIITAILIMAITLSACVEQGSMQEAQARQIAADSVCTEHGPLGDESTYNPNSRTWWIDIRTDEAPGCAPACVVYENSSAEINWRCTGALPPEGAITTFEECAAAGNPIMESFPRQCQADGMTFTEETQEPLCKDLCGDGRCQEIVCMGTGCPCAESAESCPEDCG